MPQKTLGKKIEKKAIELYDTAKEKAEELYEKYKFVYIPNYTSNHEVKQCAIILCNEMIAECGTGYARGKFWEEVKKEITKL